MSSIIKSDNGVSSGVTGIVQTADSSGQLAFQTTTSGGSAVTALTIDNSQKVTFANTIGFGSNAGITFNNSSALTNSTLNDYETGTWAPTQGGGLTVVGTFSSAGTYTKIGNTVYINGKVSGTTSVALSAGGVISALPFACLSTSPSLSIAGRICNNSGAVDIASYVSGSIFAALSGSVAATSNIFFTAVYQATF